MATAPKAAPKVVAIDDGAATPAAAPPKKSKKKLLILGVLLILLLAGAGGAWHFLGAESDPNTEAAPQPALPPVYLALDQFTVNLQPEVGEQFLQIAFTLQVSDQAQVDQIKLYMPLVRSRLLMLLSSKKPSNLTSPEGKQKLQDEIITALRAPFAPNTPEVGVTGVFFTSFVIQ